VIFLNLIWITGRSAVKRGFFVIAPNKQGQETFSSAPSLRAGLFSNLSAGDICPFSILDFVELRLPPPISHEETAPSRQSRQKKPPTSATFAVIPLIIDGVVKSLHLLCYIVWPYVRHTTCMTLRMTKHYVLYMKIFT